jgi:hypothetical protein
MQPTPSDLLPLISIFLISSHLRPGPLSGLLFPTEHFHAFTFSPVCSTGFTHLIFIDFINRTTLKKQKIMQLLIAEFSSSFSSAPFSRTPYRYVLPVKFHSYTTQTSSWKYCLCYKRGTFFVWVMNGLLRFKTGVKITLLKSDNGLWGQNVFWLKCMSSMLSPSAALTHNMDTACCYEHWHTCRRLHGKSSPYNRPGRPKGGVDV